MFDTSNITKARFAIGPRNAEIAEMIKSLEQAAARFARRTDTFAVGKSNICLDIAAKVEKFGNFASGAQREFAQKLIAWSLPRDRGQGPAAAPDWGRPVPKLFAVLQKHTHFHADPLKLSRRNQDSLCWIIWNGACVGKIENERATVWKSKAEAAGATALAVLAVIEEFEADPLATAQKYGKESGR